MMKVLCVKSRDKYTPDYVLNLQKMVRRHLPIPHEFICMTEHPIDGVTCVPFPDDMPVIDQRYEGWWYKVGLYKPGYFTGDKLYLDLDVVITDSLLPIVALLYKSPGLWARDDFSYPVRNPRQGLDAGFLKLLGGPGCVNSSVTLWHDDVASDVWTKFRPEVMDEMHGDQNHLSSALRDRIQFMPDNLIHSYKYHVLHGEGPGHITVFHGQPKVTDLPKHDPLREAWGR
jgi:hypothetical protein